jgi:hypothetical protein
LKVCTVSRDPLPEPWRSELEIKGIHSKRGLATKAGISPQTAKRLIDGEGSPSHATVAAVADAIFGGNRDRVWELAGFERQDHGDWSLPPEASLLDPEQRAAVLAVVRAMLPPEQRAGDGDDRDATSTSSPGPERTVADVLEARRQANMKMQTEAARREED